jgi:hypothetical protein
LIHCSDGWDRSSQLISTSQLLLDPYYRSIEGFIVLIEKEWLSFGHQFALRNGLVTKDGQEDQKAPIFLQWLDAIHQLLVQFPQAFEFNLDFLVYIAIHYNSNLYGTFLYNCEKDRYEKNAHTKTVSIWTDILENIKLYRNPYYKMINKVLEPCFSLYKIRFWEEYFLRIYNFKEVKETLNEGPVNR